MKSIGNQSRNRAAYGCALAALVAGPLSGTLYAADVYWDTNSTTAGYGSATTGPWSTNNGSGNRRWGNAAGTASPATWTNNDNAIFASTSTAATITIDTGNQPTVRRMVFDVDGYVVQTGTLTLTTSGTGGTAGSVAVSTGTATINSVVAGSVGLTKNGNGTLALGGNNTYNGGTTISAGTLVANHAGALGSSGTITFGGGTLRYGSGITTDLSARFSGASGQAYSVDTNGQNVTFASALGSSDGSLTKLGSGILTLGGANAYAGDTVVTGGTLRLGASDRISNASRLVLNGGTLSTNGNSDILGTLQLTDSSTIDMGSGSSQLLFEESFAEAWAAGKTLNITNYTNNLDGTGVDRIYVGTALNGLTWAQLQQIKFVNPDGFAPGTYGAMLSSDGQVLIPEPASLSLLAMGGSALLMRRRRKA